MTTTDAPKPARRIWLHALPWLVTIACFTWLYRSIGAKVGPERSPLGYLAEVFASVPWGQWLALMLPYSVLFLLVDTLVLWRAVNWFNAKVPYTSLLPVRASAYILSLLNEQVGKGAIALYLNRTRGVPGWQVGSSMLFIMFCEFYYLLSWGTLGTLFQWERVPPVFHQLPVLAVVAGAFFVGWVAFFRGALAPNVALRDRQIFHAFRQARWWQYVAVILLRSPALIVAVFVYAHSLRLFGVDAGYGELLGYLPIIFFGAAVPGPFRAVAVAMWPLLYPDRAAELTAFGLVQHNFFIFFNAAIGLCFLRRANRELFSEPSGSRRAPAPTSRPAA